MSESLVWVDDSEITHLLVGPPGFTSGGFGPVYPVSVSTPLTKEAAVQRAVDLVRQDPHYYSICANGSGTHVVSPTEMAAGGVARCADCFAFVDLGPREPHNFAPTEGRWTGRFEPRGGWPPRRSSGSA